MLAAGTVLTSAVRYQSTVERTLTGTGKEGSFYGCGNIIAVSAKRILK